MVVDAIDNGAATATANNALLIGGRASSGTQEVPADRYGVNSVHNVQFFHWPGKTW